MDVGALNALFVLGRSMGFIGGWFLFAMLIDNNDDNDYDAVNDKKKNNVDGEKDNNKSF